MIRTLPVRARPIGEALALGGALLDVAGGESTPYLAASVLEGRGVVLGGSQRAGRVVDLEACARAGVEVYRRASSGTAAWVGGRALHFALALPSITALVSDTTARTVLNRNVRGFLRGFTRAGALAHYFGREWIAVQHRPAALLGFELAPTGALLLEVLAGIDEGIALPDSITTEDERALDRYRGREPIALASVLSNARSLVDTAELVCNEVAARAGRTLHAVPELTTGPATSRRVSHRDDPLEDARFIDTARVAVPIGYVEAARYARTTDAAQPHALWIGGDALVPRFALAELARAIEGGGEVPDLSRVPMEGATERDFVEVARACASGTGSSAR